MDTKRDTTDLVEVDRHALRLMIEDELAADPDNEFLWDLLTDAA